MSVRSHTKGRRHGKPPRPRQRDLTPELLHQFMEDRAESSEYPYQRTWREALSSIEKKRKIREATHLQSTITRKRKSYAH